MSGKTRLGNVDREVQILDLPNTRQEYYRVIYSSYHKIARNGTQACYVWISRGMRLACRGMPEHPIKSYSCCILLYVLGITCISYVTSLFIFRSCLQLQDLVSMKCTIEKILSYL